MTQVKRRYTSTNGEDWIVSVSWNPQTLNNAHWFEARVDAVGEASGKKMALPPEIRTYRIGEAERPFRDWVVRDWAGDREAAIEHHVNSIYRRVYSFIERGH